MRWWWGPLCTKPPRNVERLSKWGHTYISQNANGQLACLRKKVCRVLTVWFSTRKSRWIYEIFGSLAWKLVDLESPKSIQIFIMYIVLQFQMNRWNSIYVMWKDLHLQTENNDDKGPSWSWSYDSWINNYLCTQWLSPLTLWVWIPLGRGVLHTTLFDKCCYWLATGQWFSPRTPVSSTNKTDRHDIAELLWKVTSNTISQPYILCRMVKDFLLMFGNN